MRNLSIIEKLYAGKETSGLENFTFIQITYEIFIYVNAEKDAPRRTNSFTCIYANMCN